MQEKHAKQANFLIPDVLLSELKKIIPRGKQSHFVAQAIQNEIKRLHFQISLKKSFGAWKQQPHPELKRGSSHFIHELRQSSRLKRPL